MRRIETIDPVYRRTLTTLRVGYIDGRTRSDPVRVGRMRGVEGAGGASPRDGGAFPLPGRQPRPQRDDRVGAARRGASAHAADGEPLDRARVRPGSDPAAVRLGGLLAGFGPPGSRP